MNPPKRQPTSAFGSFLATVAIFAFLGCTFHVQLEEQALSAMSWLGGAF